MTKRLMGVVTLLVLQFASVVQSQPRVDAFKPNIVFILMDNLGYGELGVYGGGEFRGAPTPRITSSQARERA